MNKDRLEKMDKARHLLPEPGNEVVGELITELRKFIDFEEDEEKIDEALFVLYDYAKIQGAEMSWLWNSLIDLWDNSEGYVSDAFRKSLYQEIFDQACSATMDYEVVEITETKEVKTKILQPK